MQPSEQARNRQELRKAFVAGAKWWNCHTRDFPLWPNRMEFAQTEAEKQYGRAKVHDRIPPGFKVGKLVEATPEELNLLDVDEPHWTVIYDKEPE